MDPLPVPIELEGLDDTVQRYILELLNLVQAQAAELQRLRDEVARLKGQKPSTPNPPSSPSQEQSAPKRGQDLSSEKKRQEKKPAVHRRQPLEVDRTERVVVDRSKLPPDACFKGYERTVVQDMVFARQNTAFEREKFYSPRTHSTFLAPLPVGYEASEYGPGIRSLVLILHYGCGVTQPKLRSFLNTMGVQISSGEVSNLLTQNQERFHEEKDEVFQAGLESTPWQQIDDTGTNFDGEHWHCHMVCNPFYTVYCTRPSKDRATVIEVLCHGQPVTYRVTYQAVQDLNVSAELKSKLEQLPFDCALSDDALEDYLSKLGDIGKTTYDKLMDTFLREGYRGRTQGPVVRALLTDGALTFLGVTDEHGLCWIHEGRLYKKLSPAVSLFADEVEDFLDLFWDFYRELLVYKDKPTATEAKRLSTRFDEVFSHRVGYDELTERMARTRSKKEQLLLVLKHPEIPLHNNAAELAARDRVRKRDISLAAHSLEGLQAWDTFASLLATAKKLGVNVLRYFEDRLRGLNEIPRLADLIRQRAEQMPLGGSWQAAVA